MAGGGAVVPAAAFNFLEDFGLSKFWIRHSNGSVTQWFSGSLVVLSASYLRVVLFGVALGYQDVSLRGRPGVLYDGFLASLVSLQVCVFGWWTIILIQIGWCGRVGWRKSTLLWVVT